MTAVTDPCEHMTSFAKLKRKFNKPVYYIEGMQHRMRTGVLCNPVHFVLRVTEQLNDREDRLWCLVRKLQCYSTDCHQCGYFPWCVKNVEDCVSSSSQARGSIRWSVSSSNHVSGSIRWTFIQYKIIGEGAGVGSSNRSCMANFDTPMCWCVVHCM